MKLQNSTYLSQTKAKSKKNNYDDDAVHKLCSQSADSLTNTIHKYKRSSSVIFGC